MKDLRVFVEEQAEETRRVYLAGYEQGVKETEKILAEALEVLIEFGVSIGQIEANNPVLVKFRAVIAKAEARGVK